MKDVNALVQLERYQRRTTRLSGQVKTVVKELAGRAGARVLAILAVGRSRHTALRALLRIPLPTGRAPRVIGVDDFAAADNLLTLAEVPRAYPSLMKVVATQGGWHTLYGNALALTGTLTAWADLTGQDIGDVIDTALS